jgi:tripartite-type tricarboxylate transporter receptor subunit TctC
VPYPTGAAAQTDVIGGRVPILIDGLGGIAPHVKGDRLRLLAVSTQKRAKEFPNVPTISEAVPGLVVPGINSLMAPTGTPVAILDQLNAKVREIMADPAIVERFAGMGGDATVGTRPELETLLKGQRVLFRQLIDNANIKPD